MSEHRPQVPIHGRPISDYLGRLDVSDTARATKQSRELIEMMFEHSVETAEAIEVCERQMLRWTQAGVVLAGIAAVASIIAILVTFLVGR